MDALSPTALHHIHSFTDTYPAKNTANSFHSLKILPTFVKTPSLRSAHPLSAIARDMSDDGSRETPFSLPDNDNGVPGIVPQETPSLPQQQVQTPFSLPDNDNGVPGIVPQETPSLPQQQGSDLKKSGEKEVNSTRPPLVVPHGSSAGGGTRAGLFRTPISGGVQNATSAHGLPRPSLAVRNLMEQARFAHLCTVMSRMHHRREGYPFGSLVDFAPDSMGHPIFSLSPLAIHTRNLLTDPRCTLVVQIPGWSSLSNARVTIFGDVYPLPEDEQEWAHKQYLAKHHQGPSQQWGNFYYFRMQSISDIYFVGGFGTVAWIDVKEYEALQPDKIAADGGEQNLKELNAIFSKPLKELLSIEVEVDDVAFISVDGKGVDIRVRQGTQYNVQRISFAEGHNVETLEGAKKALWELLDRSQVHNLQQ